MFTLFFVTPEAINDSEIRLRGAQAHHAITVLRVQKGQSLRFADGLGNWVEGSITDIAKDALTIIAERRGQDKTAKTKINNSPQ